MPARYLIERNCIACGATFRPRRSEQRFCSKACGLLGRPKRPINPVGEWHISFHGYVVRKEYIDGVRKTIKQHRKMMEDSLGRALSVDEDVHHKNGVKTDNRMDNLELISHAEHTRLHNMKRIYTRGKKIKITDSDRQRRAEQGKRVLSVVHRKWSDPVFQERTRENMRIAQHLRRKAEREAGGST